MAALAISATLPAKQTPQGPNEDGTAPALVKIAGEAMLESHAFEYLTELSDDVGSRVTGSPEDQRAIDWGAAKMRAIGLENVHAEKFSMWRGWTRGYAKAELTSPIRRPLHVDAMGWTGSTPAGGVEAEVVAANNFDLDTETTARRSALAQPKPVLFSRLFGRQTTVPPPAPAPSRPCSSSPPSASRWF